MDMDMGSGGGSMMPLNDSGVDFTNETQAFNFLQEILDDTYLQVYGEQAARQFWYGAVVVIGVAGIWNLLWRWTSWARINSIRASRARRPLPHNSFTNTLATATAIGREVSYLQLTPARAAFWVRVPPVGVVLVVVAYLGFILALEFTGPDVAGAQHDQNLSVRAAWLAVAQMPLVVLLAGKNNLIGLVAGVSYERLNVLHRWVARGLLLLVTLHFALESWGWDAYPGLMVLEWQTDACPPTGISAYAILLWMNLSTLAPLRRLSYDVFVAQHIITWFGFVIAVMMHLSTTVLYSRVYVYIPVGLYLLDRLVRIARLAWHNLPRPGRAVLEPLGHDAVRVRVLGCRVKTWAPGSHVLLAIPRLGPAQSHPATMLSTPSSHGGELVFIMRVFRGFTRNLLKAAEASSESLASASAATFPQGGVAAAERAERETQKSYVALVDGPYGGRHADFAGFGTVFLVAGGTGVTFTTGVLLGLADRVAAATASDESGRPLLPLRVLHFLWVVKRRDWLVWIAPELRSATDSLRAAGVEVHVDIFVTCDDHLTDSKAMESPAGAGGRQCGGVCTCGAVKVVADGEDGGGRSGSGGGNGKVEVSVKMSERDAENEYALLLPSLRVATGRPQFRACLWDALCHAEGETGIGACGPLGLLTAVRSDVVKISHERAVHKGTGAQGIYLHAESFN